jgi:hypothetical protein
MDEKQPNLREYTRDDFVKELESYLRMYDAQHLDCVFTPSLHCRNRHPVIEAYPKQYVRRTQLESMAKAIEETQEKIAASILGELREESVRRGQRIESRLSELLQKVKVFDCADKLEEVSADDVLFKITHPDPAPIKQFIERLLTEFSTHPLLNGLSLSGVDHAAEAIEQSIGDEKGIVRRIRHELIDSLVTAFGEHIADESEISKVANEGIV